jgi:uncharacterized protein with FMN-binding domain
VVLSSTVIAAIYAAGYVRTQSADQQLAAAESAPVPTAAISAPAPGSAIPPSTGPTVPLSLVSPTTTIASGLRDGTYQGHGTSRRGDIYVQLDVQGGRITNVQITRSTTAYPVSRISALPGEVVARQSAAVDTVSGATLSARAFKQAVAQAITQAAQPS